MNEFAPKRKPIILLFTLAFALVSLGAAPHPGGLPVAAKRGNPPGAARASRLQEPRRFENTEVRLGIIDGGLATTSAIEVSGLTGKVADVDINLININHGPTSTQDIDVLLIGPEGKTALILSDVGGNTETRNVTLVLDDQQDEQLPGSSALSSGFFQPTNVGSPDTMNLGNGPFTPPSGASLGRFNGVDPNGTWRIWVYDDTANGSSPAGGGINGGWAITITTTADDGVSARPDTFRATAGKTVHVDTPGVLANDTGPNGDPLTASLVAAPKKGELTLKADGSFIYKAKKQAKGKDTFTYQARTGTGLSAKAKVTIGIKPARTKGNAGKRDQP